MHNSVARMQNQNKCQTISKIKVIRVIPKSYSCELSLTPHIVTLCQAKKVSGIMSILRQFDQQRAHNANTVNKQHDGPVQIQEFQQASNEENPCLLRKEGAKKERMFLKRVKKIGPGLVQVLICKEESPEKEQLMQILVKQGFAEHTELRQLPEKAPVTKQQFEQWSKIWPINFIQQQYAKDIPHSSPSLELLNFLQNTADYGKGHVALLSAELSEVLLKEEGDCSGFPLGHAVMKLLAKWPESQAYRAHPQKYYYLTGLKLFVCNNLCGMCSMALVHSRLKAVYSILEPTPVMDSIMGCPSLNHQVIMFIIK